MSRLRAIRAIFGTAPGLDAQEHTSLHLVGAVAGAVDQLRPEKQVRQRRDVDRLDLSQRPIVTQLLILGALIHVIQPTILNVSWGMRVGYTTGPYAARQ